MYYKVMPNGNILAASELLFWTESTGARKPEFVDATMLHHGSLLGLVPKIGPMVFATLGSPGEMADLSNRRWDAVTQLLDGSLAILSNGALFRAVSPRSAKWDRVATPPSPPFVPTDLTTLPDGTVLCLGADGSFWCGTPDLVKWQAAPDILRASLARIEALPDGTVLGVSWDKKPEEPGSLFSMPPDRSNWFLVDSSFKLRNIAALPGGALLGITDKGKVLVSHTGAAPWRNVAKPPNGAAVLARGTTPTELIALGKDGHLYRTDQTATGLAPWAPAAYPAPPVPLVAIATSPETATFFGVGADKLLYRYASGAWTADPKAGRFGSVAVLGARGDLVAAGPPGPDNTGARFRFDHRDGWQNLPPGPAVATLGTAHDGAILEVRPDGGLYRRPAPDTDPVAVGGDGFAHALYVPDPVDDSPGKWLLPFTSDSFQSVTGDGRPWGDGTAMADRAVLGGDPWDEGCGVTPMIGGGEALAAIRDVLEAAILDAESAAGKPGERGHVYIAGWLLNGLRDLSEDNPWGLGSWATQLGPVNKDQTALGLIGRVMAAGIKVRVMVWMPTTTQSIMTAPHSRQHAALAAAIAELNANLCRKKGWETADPIGVCALDMRTAPSVSASLHQKTVVVRVGDVNVAFCGGTDMAFTRRDAGRPVNSMVGVGDWQSGSTIPIPADTWPRAVLPAGGSHPAFPLPDGVAELFPDELPEEVYKQPRHWHDQHLKLEGPIVTTLEQQFDERWRINAQVVMFDPAARYGADDRVQFTSPKMVAAEGGERPRILPLDVGKEPGPAGGAIVQMWRTIPLDARRKGTLFTRGEFTIMAGVARAVSGAEKLITIWDQYFWSEPLARLLAQRLTAVPGLRLLVVIPPHGSSEASTEMAYRRRAMKTLWKGLSDNDRKRVLVLNAWNHATNAGVYVHAKVQTYDDCLLVCGSANMNRRSFTCDMELDCAVLHRPTVRRHLARLAHMVLGRPWTDFADGWTGRLWSAAGGAASGKLTPGLALTPDPFFCAVDGTMTLNGVPYKPDRTLATESAFEPTSLTGANVETAQPTGPPYQADAVGRLDFVVHLLESHNDGKTFPYRI